jgi:uncharacterized protein (DUF2141 family)
MKVSTSLLLIAMFAANCVHTAQGSDASSSTAQQASQSAKGCALRIHVEGLRDSSGVVGAAIFKSADGWPEDMTKSFRHWPTPIEAGAHEATAVMENLSPGDYGLVVIHDENGNQKMDRNFFGIPKEGFGFANNPHVGLSAAPFSASIVHVACPVTETKIHLIYK